MSGREDIDAILADSANRLSTSEDCVVQFLALPVVAVRDLRDETRSLAVAAERIAGRL